MPDLSPSSEDYLEAIFQLTNSDEGVRSVDLANHLEVSKASVHKAVHVLQDKGLIQHAHYGQIHLTGRGQKRAREILQSHRMLKRFLVEVLGLDEETAEDDACRMEHVISEKTKKLWLQWLSRHLEA